MSKASEKKLSDLHGKVAQCMLEALDQSNKASLLIERYKDDLPNDVQAFLMQCRDINPALLTSATKLLKDNNISCDITEDDQLSSLKEELANKKARVSSISFEAMH